MSLVRWDPYRELDDVSKMMTRFFGRGFEAGAGTEKMTVADWSPAVDISETPEAYLIHAELPGAKKEDIQLTVEDGMLTLKGERKSEKEVKEKKVHRVERSYGSFMRSFRLPENVDANNVFASYTDGVLEVKVPKVVPPQKSATQVKIA